MRENSLLRRQQRLYKLRHLLQHRYEMVVLFFLLYDVDFRSTLVVHSDIAYGHRQVTINQVVSFCHFPYLGTLKQIKLHNILCNLILNKFLRNIQKRIGVK